MLDNSSNQPQLSDPSESERSTILLVDDIPDNLAVLGELLQSNYRVLAATSGEQALQIALATPHPDLILLDVMMPEMDGYAVLERLRGQPATANIPVIFVTALTDGEDEVRGLDGGAVDYIQKPYRPTTVLARVRTQLELKRARDRLQQQNLSLEAEVARRVAEEHKIQEQFLQAEKLASLGQLVAGVAHEINNPISFVLSNLGTLEGYITDLLRLIDSAGALARGEGSVAQFDAIIEEIDFDFIRDDIVQLVDDSQGGLARVRTLIQDLKAHAHNASSNWEWADLHHGIDAVLNIVSNELKYKCQVEKIFGEIPLVWCVPAQIDQVIMNLLINAAQAIPERGRVTITTEVVDKEVMITVADTGVGIPADNIQHLFEPFFTTKPVGTGTGLGLSLTYSIVNRHQGRIEVESEVGVGTQFHIILPIEAVGDDIPSSGV